MSDRRRLLMAISNTGKWLPYAFEYLYHDLIPTTIDGKQVKNKLKLAIIDGNSVVENQLVNKLLFNPQASNVSFDTSTGKIELDLSTFVRYDNNIFNSYVIDIVQGHTYLLRGFKTSSTNASDTSWWTQIRTSASGSSGRLYNQNEIFTALNSGSASVFIYVYNSFTANDKIVGYPQLIDLTQMFPFDTPTTLNDNRVQALLNRGYIPYNTGELKSVNIGEFSTTKADATALATISFKYQGGGVGTSHDTMEIGKENVVFTKDRAFVDLGTLNWIVNNAVNGRFLANYSSNQSIVGSIKVPADLNTVSNSLCSKYQVQTWNNISANIKGVAVYGGSSGGIYVCDSSYANQTAEQFKTAMSGVMLEYQLATPQVITIPRKHLASYTFNGTETFIDYSGSGTSLTIALTNLKGVSSNNDVANIYWNFGLTTSVNGISGSTQEYSIAVGTSGRLYIATSKTSSQLADSLIGKTIYYETQDEVADILNTIGVESGGTFTSNMFSWVENQQCADNFTDSSYWVRNRVTQTNSNNVATFVANSNAYDFVGFYRGANAGEFKKGHKYLISSNIRKTSGNGNAFRLEWQGISGTIQTISNPTLNTWYSFETIIEQTREDTQTTNAFVVSMRYASTSDIVVNSDSFECKEVEWVDLTLAFGSGNEPTSVSDPRIQKIIEMGYIPTNTTGTYKSVDTEVLPNFDTKIKCK